MPTQKKASESQRLGELGGETASQFAAWLEELKQYKEENQPETNLDHYRDEVLEKHLWNLAVVKGKPKQCNVTRCINCEFSKTQPKECHKKGIEWLKQQYTKPTYELTKFENDLLQSCSQVYSPRYQFKNIIFLTRMKEKGCFKDVDEDATIEDILAEGDKSV